MHFSNNIARTFSSIITVFLLIFLPITSQAQDIPRIKVIQYHKSIKLPLENIYEGAQTGILLDIPFKCKITKLDDVEKAWGKTNKSESINSCTYLTYTKHNVELGFNKDGVLFHMQYLGLNYNKIRYKDVKHILNPPTKTIIQDHSYILVYPCANDCELLFTFPEICAKNTNPSLKSITLFAPNTSHK